MNKINYVRFDWAIKKLLRDKANFGILEGFIEFFYLNRIAKFSKFLKVRANSEIKSDTKVPGLVEAKKVMKFDKMSKEEQDTYIRHLDAVANEKEAILTAEIRGKIEGRAEGREEGRAEGEKIGIEKGISKRNKQVATEMKKQGLSVEMISTVLQLPKEEIEKLLCE